MRKVMLVLIASLWAGIVYAQSDRQSITNFSAALDLSLPKSEKFAVVEDDTSNSLLILAAADEQRSAPMNQSKMNQSKMNQSKMNQSKKSAATAKFEERMFTGNKIHKYLGIGSIGAALLTVIAPKNDSIHENLAKTTAALSVGAVATGFAYHYEDISIDGGLDDPDNIHALSAGLGALGIALAASIGPDVPHATFGALGAIGMMVGVKYTW